MKHRNDQSLCVCVTVYMYDPTGYLKLVSKGLAGKFADVWGRDGALSKHLILSLTHTSKEMVACRAFNVQNLTNFCDVKKNNIP